jgi:DNA-directed RNA polymerase specialized sigma24 family protein
MPHSEHGGHFPTTQWTLISRLRSKDDAVSSRALDELCAQYHYPLYCYIRRRGLDHHDAQDVLHDFLAKLIRLESFQTAEEEKGRLRGFLGTALSRFLSSWHSSQNKRAHDVSLDEEMDLAAAEQRFQRERLSDDETPERLFERKWAHELIRHVLRRMKREHAARGKQALFDALKPVLLDGGSLRGHDHEAIAASLGMSPGSLRTALTRLLDSFRDLLREEVAETVEDKAEIEDEITHLMKAFERK